MMKVCLICADRFDRNDWKCPSCGYTPEALSGYRIFITEPPELGEGFDREYFESLAKIEENHWWFFSRRKLVIWALRRYFPESGSFFEVGCGTGFMLLGIREAFSDVSVSGSDLFMEGLTYAGKRLPDVSLFQMDAQRIPFEEEFDVIGAFDVLEHVDDDEEVLSQLFKAVKRGGGIIVTVPQHPFLWSKQDKYSFHKRRYTREGLIEKVRKVGFQEKWSTSFVFLLFPLMFLVRLRRDKKDGEFDVFEELRPVSSLNQVLLKIMSAEVFMIRRGISLPVGGSLLLVAIKV
jgi:SAM-dependent methyltransferase